MFFTLSKSLKFNELAIRTAAVYIRNIFLLYAQRQATNYTSCWYHVSSPAETVECERDFDTADRKLFYFAIYCQIMARLELGQTFSNWEAFEKAKNEYSKASSTQFITKNYRATQEVIE